MVRRGFGQRSVDTEKPATADTLYAVGSVAKSVTALATLVLDERNQLDIEDAVSEYVPYFEDAPGDPISIHQLLSHTSGMPRDDLPFIATEIDGWDDFRTFLDGTIDRRRTDYHQCIYYNSGYAVLARLVEVVTGMDFPSFVERTIFDSLGMSRSTYDSSVIEEESADVMTPYFSENDGFTEATLAENPLLHGPGGLLSSVTELATFLQAHMGDNPSLNSVPLKRLRTPIGTLKRFIDGTERAYGYGWEIEPFDSDTLISHGGGTGRSHRPLHS
nr:serine hydrolase domain-containing protein [Haladaptatus halobius]